MNSSTIAALLLGAPLAIMCGGVIMHMMLFVLVVSLLYYSPVVGIFVLLAWAARWLIPWFFAGLGFGLGAGRGKRP